MSKKYLDPVTRKEKQINDYATYYYMVSLHAEEKYQKERGKEEQPILQHYEELHYGSRDLRQMAKTDEY